MGVDGPAQADEGVVLDRLGHDQVAAGPEDPGHLGQHHLGVGQVVEHVDRPHQARRRRPQR
jgi:hypothetical protein